MHPGYEENENCLQALDALANLHEALTDVNQVQNNNGQLRIANATSGGARKPPSELRIVPLGSSSRLTVRQRGKVIYSVFFLGGSSSVLAVLATIIMSA